MCGYSSWEACVHSKVHDEIEIVDNVKRTAQPSNKEENKFYIT
jgi:hypothetical protein